MAVLTAFCSCADVYFFGDRVIGQQALIGSQTFSYLITWYFILYTVLKKYLDTQNEFIFNKILIIMI